MNYFQLVWQIETQSSKKMQSKLLPKLRAEAETVIKENKIKLMDSMKIGTETLRREAGRETEG